MQNPTIPSWLAMIANAGLLIVPLLLQVQNIPAWVTVVLGALAAVLTYLAHLNTSRKDAEKLEAVRLGIPAGAPPSSPLMFPKDSGRA
jgi:hypothetical protein